MQLYMSYPQWYEVAPWFSVIVPNEPSLLYIRFNIFGPGMNLLYINLILSAMASQITGVSIVCPSVCSGANQWKNWSPSSLVIVMGIHRWLVDFPHKGIVTRKCFHLMTPSWKVLSKFMLDKIKLINIAKVRSALFTSCSTTISFKRALNNHYID